VHFLSTLSWCIRWLRRCKATITSLQSKLQGKIKPATPATYS